MKRLIECVGLAIVVAVSPVSAEPAQYAVRFLGEAARIEGIHASGVLTGWRLSPSPARGFVAGIDPAYTLLPIPASYLSSLEPDLLEVLANWT